MSLLPQCKFIPRVLSYQKRAIQQSTRTKTALQTPTETQKHGFDATLKIPEFGRKHVSHKPVRSNQVFSYFMVGTLGVISAAGAKATLHGIYSRQYRSGIMLIEKTSWSTCPPRRMYWPRRRSKLDLEQFQRERMQVAQHAIDSGTS